jgi:hypothetical protein
MKFQVIHPFNIVQNGKCKTYAMGQRISETAYNRLNKRQQERFLPARAAARKTPYLREEVEFIVRAYLQNDSRNSVRTAFQKQFPNSKHTGDSIMMTACLLENLDNTKDGQDGSVYHMTDLVIRIAQEIDPDRFSDPSIDSKLDSLLASIR